MLKGGSDHHHERGTIYICGTLISDVVVVACWWVFLQILKNKFPLPAVFDEELPWESIELGEILEGIEGSTPQFQVAPVVFRLIWLSLSQSTKVFQSTFSMDALR